MKPEVNVARFVLTVWITTIALVALDSGAQQAGGLPACDPAKGQCCLIECPAKVTPPTAEACLKDACACAQQLDCYLQQVDLNTWPVFPQSEPQHLNTGATHGRFVTTRVSPEHLSAVERAVEAREEPVDLPAGTILAKQNYLAEAGTGPNAPLRPALGPDSPFPTVMYKLEGYCPDGARQANGDCAGGEWFWYLKRFERFPFTGKSNFCLDCHGAAADGDWSWQIELFRRFPNNSSTDGGAP